MAAIPNTWVPMTPLGELGQLQFSGGRLGGSAEQALGVPGGEKEGNGTRCVLGVVVFVGGDAHCMLGGVVPS